MGRASLLTEGLGWTYAFVLVGYFGGMIVSGIRVHTLTAWWRSWDIVALAALVVGWPTGLRTQKQVLSGVRDLRSLVNRRTRPTLFLFAASFVPFPVLTFLLVDFEGNWQLWVQLPFAAVAVVTSNLTWLMDAAWHSSPEVDHSR